MLKPKVEEQIKNIVATWRAKGLDVPHLARKLADAILVDMMHGADRDDGAVMLRTLAAEVRQ